MKTGQWVLKNIGYFLPSILYKLKLKKIYAGTLDSNIASQKVFKKSKFKIEAKLLDYRILNKKFVNEIIMSRTNV